MTKTATLTLAIGIPLAILAIAAYALTGTPVQAAPAGAPLQAPGDCVVTTTADSGPGSLRQCMLDLQSGMTVTFDVSVFPPADPASIALTRGLPAIVTDNVTIDGSNAGVVLDGSAIGAAPSATLLDDVSLSLDGGPNLIANGDFAVGQGHWRPWDSHLGATRSITTADVHSSPNSYEWNSVARAGDSRTVYDTVDTSDPAYNPFGDSASTVWIGATGGSTATLRFWYRYGGLGVSLYLLYPDDQDILGEWWFDTQANWTQASITQTLPDTAIGLGVAFVFGYPERRTPGLHLSCSGSAIRGLQILHFPGHGLVIDGGAQYNAIGGDTTIGSGPLGQGNLISDNGIAEDDYGVVVRGSSTVSNTLSGNRIGTDLAGTSALANRGRGIWVADGASYNVIGGDTPGERNLISGNGRHGVTVEWAGTTHNTVSGNYIGTDASGTAVLPNGGEGVELDDGTSHNLVGGDTPGERNLVSGNSGAGVIVGDGSSYNIVSGNYIGTDVSGTAVLPNEGDGVHIGQGASDNVVGGVNGSPGGACTGECNLISGNRASGIAIVDGGTISNTVSGNMIGTDVHGTMALPNDGTGIRIDDWASANTVGGSIPGERNLISGNGENGVRISDFSDGNTISGNYVGTDASGGNAIPNAQNGVRISAGSTYNLIGGVNATPGAGCSGECNLISGNGASWGYGVSVEDGGTVSNTVSGNYIGLNASGTAAIPNPVGVNVETGASYTLIGGDAPGQENVVSGNRWNGITVINAGDGTRIIGNQVGVGGVVTAGNGSSGIAVAGGSPDTEIRDNLVQGNGLAQGDGGMYLMDSPYISPPPPPIERARILSNTVADNSGFGVRIDASGALVQGNVVHGNGQVGVRVINGKNGNTLTQNSIYDHLGQGIELFDGSNDGISPPLIGYRDLVGGVVTGTACANCQVEVFSDDQDEGRWYEGAVTADGSGAWTLNKGSALTGTQVQATATDASGNSSEFSGPPPLVSGISPVGTVQGTVGLIVTIYGDRFLGNVPPTVDLGAGISVTDTKFISRTQLQAVVDVDAGAALGTRDVTVTNYDGQSGTGSGLFEVLSTSPFPPPAIEGVYPDQIAATDQSVTLIVTGSDFIEVFTVVLDPGAPDVVIEDVNADSSDRFELRIHVWPTTTLGTVDLTLTNPDGGSDILANAFEVITPLFTDIAPSAGINQGGERGIAWGDYDRDGDLDIYVSNSNVLYRNNGDHTFTDVTASAGGLWSGTEGPAWGDFDNDGDLDLFVTDWESNDALYRNEGDGTFVDVVDQADLRDPGQGLVAAWVDYDRDGHLDLSIANGSDDGCRLYRNQGDGTFLDVTTGAGLVGTASSGGLAWGDYDNDGDPDLYVAKSDKSHLFQNQGDGTFVDKASELGVTTESYYGENGVAWGDYDNDGDLDLAISANWSAVLLRNDGDAFTDVTTSAGTGVATVSGDGVAWGDYDNDGWLDLNVTGPQGTMLLHNRGDGTFEDVNHAAGIGGGLRAWGSAWGDYDNDGDLDLYVVQAEDGGVNLDDRLYRNDVIGGHWLHVKTVGTLSNHAGIGARVRAVAGGTIQIREVSGGSGRSSQDSLPVEFGFGSYSGTASVEVTWPSGVVDTLANVAPDQAIVVTESTPYLHDVAVVHVTPDGQVPVGTALAVQATLRNLGNLAEADVAITCTIAHQNATVYDASRASAAMQPGAWSTVDLASYTPSALGTHTLTCRSVLPGDQQPANDVYSHTLTVVSQQPDAWTRDNPGDDGDVPSGYTNWYVSPDVWVRHLADGGLVHQEPVAGVANTVYVRLRNRGTAPVSGTVDVYWIEPSLGVRCGDWAYIDTISFADLLPGEVRIVDTSWVPTRTGHTCLQTVIDTPGDPYDRGLECSPLWVPGDNNVSWRNLEIFENPDSTTAQTMDVEEAQVQLVNIYDRPQDIDIIIERLTFPATGTIAVALPGDLFERWLAYGAHWGDAIEVVTASKEIRVSGAVSATIGAIPMLADEGATVTLRFDGPAGLSFEMAIRERIDGVTVGGVAYQWIIPDTWPPHVVAVSPAHNATDAALNAPIVIAFDEEIGPLSLGLALTPTLALTTTWNEVGTVVTVTHAPFVEGTTYAATVSARDASGNEMASYVWSFATSLADVDPPSVTGTAPSSDETKVSLDATIVITFSEPISTSSLALWVVPSVDLTLAWNGTSTTLTATHTGLAQGTTYTVTVSASDIAGNAMDRPYTWSFATRVNEFDVYLPLVRR